jgi:hypothetical protein
MKYNNGNGLNSVLTEKATDYPDKPSGSPSIGRY